MKYVKDGAGTGAADNSVTLGQYGRTAPYCPVYISAGFLFGMRMREWLEFAVILCYTEKNLVFGYIDNGDKQERHMGKLVKKIIILVVIFVLALAGYFIWSFFGRSSDKALYTSIEDADLPVAYVEICGHRMNALYGFTQDMPQAAGRGDLAVLPEDRSLSVIFDEVNSTVKGIQYEVRSLDGERLVERTALEEWSQEDREVRARLNIQNLITEDEEYRLTLAIATEEHPAVYYYTRIVWPVESHAQEMIDLALSFSEKTFDYSAARDLTTYLETDPNADNSSLGRVTLKNDFNQLTWRQMNVERIGDVYIHLRELQGIMGCVELEYLAKETKEDGSEIFYDVTESFTMKWGSQRIYMMNYDRRANQIFDGDDGLYSGERILLGISDAEELQAVSDASGRYYAFVANRVLWCYDSQEKESTKVFAFRNSEDDFRVNGNSYSVRILSVSGDGAVDFLVCGYMSRGNHEGTTGMALYRYESAQNTLTERLYLPAGTDYGSLRQDLSRLCYLNSSQTLYLMMDHAVYGVDLTGKEYVLVADGLTEKNFAVSTDGSRIAWQEGEDLYGCKKLNVMDLKTGKKDEIIPPDGAVVRLIGFVGSDLVYGLSHDGEQLLTDGRVTGALMYAVEIVGSDMETETRYEKQDIYMTEVGIQDSRVHLERVRRTATGYEPVDEDTLVCNEEVACDPLSGTGYMTTQEKGRQFFVQLASGLQAGNARLQVPKSAVAEENNVIALSESKEPETRMYYAYCGGRMEGTFADFSSAVEAAYDGMGVVTDKTGRVFWNRVNRSDTKTIREVQNEVILVQKYLEELAEGKETSSDGTELIDARGLSLGQVLYFIYRGKPVVAYLGNGSYMLIYGYDTYNISCYWYPGTEYAYTDKMGLNDAAAFFEQNGNNDFICFLPASSG